MLIAVSAVHTCSLFIVSVSLRLYTGVQLFVGMFTLGFFIMWLFFDRGGKIYSKERACRLISVIQFYNLNELRTQSFIHL